MDRFLMGAVVGVGVGLWCERCYRRGHGRQSARFTFGVHRR